MHNRPTAQPAANRRLSLIVARRGSVWVFWESSECLGPALSPPTISSITAPAAAAAAAPLSRPPKLSPSTDHTALLPFRLAGTVTPSLPIARQLLFLYPFSPPAWWWMGANGPLGEGRRRGRGKGGKVGRWERGKIIIEGAGGCSWGSLRLSGLLSLSSFLSLSLSLFPLSFFRSNPSPVFLLLLLLCLPFTRFSTLFVPARQTPRSRYSTCLSAAGTFHDQFPSLISSHSSVFPFHHDLLSHLSRMI